MAALNELIYELRNEHHELMNLFSSISKLRINKPESRKILHEIKERQFSHLEKEDQHLFSRIDDSDISSEKIKEYLKTYSKEMESISFITLAFFKKLEEGRMKQTEYNAEIERIIFLLKARISWEESMFYIFDRNKDNT